MQENSWADGRTYDSQENPVLTLPCHGFATPLIFASQVVAGTLPIKYLKHPAYVSRALLELWVEP